MVAADPAELQSAIDWIAGSLRRKFRPYVDGQAIESAANYGVLRALREFDPAKDKKGDFQTFLRIRGRQRAIQGLREEGAIFRRSQLAAVHKRQPPQPPLSLDAAHSEADSRSLHDILGLEDTNPAGVDARDEAAWLISCLPERQRQLVSLYFFGGLTLKQAAPLIPKERGRNRERGITEAGASLLLQDAYKRLRHRAVRAKITA